MNFRLSYTKSPELKEIELPTSKSIANRLLIASALSKNSFEISDLSQAEDTRILQKSLLGESLTIDVGMAGTAFRFLTAYLTIQKGERVLTGAERMKQRPIKILVEKLRELGASIDYLGKEGFPPLKITGSKLQRKELTIDGSVSSQYITALLLIAPYLKNGLKLNLTGDLVSLPYIDLTIALMKKLGIEVKRIDRLIEVSEGEYSSTKSVAVEKDWSSAAFFYQAVALGKGSVLLKGLRSDSIQGDRQCIELFEKLGVTTEFSEKGVHLVNNDNFNKELLELNMVETPDLIPSVAATASQLVKSCKISGVKTLRIKESNRVEALKNELGKVGVELVEPDADTIVVLRADQINQPLKFDTYNDHRIAMCLAPLAFTHRGVLIDNIEVVKKSFPNFWKELEKCGIKTENC